MVFFGCRDTVTYIVHTAVLYFSWAKVLAGCHHLAVHSPSSLFFLQRRLFYMMIFQLSLGCAENQEERQHPLLMCKFEQVLVFQGNQLLGHNFYYAILPWWFRSLYRNGFLHFCQFAWMCFLVLDLTCVRQLNLELWCVHRMNVHCDRMMPIQIWWNCLYL